MSTPFETARSVPNRSPNAGSSEKEEKTSRKPHERARILKNEMSFPHGEYRVKPEDPHAATILSANGLSGDAPPLRGTAFLPVAPGNEPIRPHDEAGLRCGSFCGKGDRAGEHGHPKNVREKKSPCRLLRGYGRAKESRRLGKRGGNRPGVRKRFFSCRARFPSFRASRR